MIRTTFTLAVVGLFSAEALNLDGIFSTSHTQHLQNYCDKMKKAKTEQAAMEIFKKARAFDYSSDWTNKCNDRQSQQIHEQITREKKWSYNYDEEYGEGSLN